MNKTEQQTHDAIVIERDRLRRVALRAVTAWAIIASVSVVLLAVQGHRSANAVHVAEHGIHLTTAETAGLCAYGNAIVSYVNTTHLLLHGYFSQAETSAAHAAMAQHRADLTILRIFRNDPSERSLSRYLRREEGVLRHQDAAAAARDRGTVLQLQILRPVDCTALAAHPLTYKLPLPTPIGP